MGTTNILDLNNRVDELEKSYPASHVMRSDGVTSVEDTLDDLAILHKTIQGTTSSGGSISLNINANNYIVISVFDSGWNKPTPFVYGGVWYCNLYDTSDSTMTAKVNITCDLSVYYMKKP